MRKNESAGEKKGKTFYDSMVFQFLYSLKLPFILSEGLSPLGGAERESREFDQGIQIAHAVTMQQHRILAFRHLID